MHTLFLTSTLDTSAMAYHRIPRMVFRQGQMQLYSSSISPTSMTTVRAPASTKRSMPVLVSRGCHISTARRGSSRIDITFVEAQNFTYQVPCFNATVGDFDLPSSSDGTDDSNNGSASDSDSSSESLSSSSDSTGGGLSGGAIAGIVVGVVAGVGLLAAGAFFIWRLRGQRERLRAQGASVRVVKWDQAERPSTTPSEQGGDVPLKDISPRT